MLTIDRIKSITFFVTFEEAEAVAAKNQEADPDWTYKAVRNEAGRAMVEVHDEDGNRLGTL